MSDKGAVEAVDTEAGRIATDTVVVAGGIWGPQLAAMAGAFVVATPVHHQHPALLPAPGHEKPHHMPCFPDPGNLVYGQAAARRNALRRSHAGPGGAWTRAA